MFLTFPKFYRHNSQRIQNVNALYYIFEIANKDLEAIFKVR